MAGRSATRGSSTRNSLPRRGPSLCASMRPPCSSIICLASAKPIPSPLCACELDSPLTNMSKMFGNISGDIPRPVSRTLATTIAPSIAPETKIFPPGFVNLIALSMILPTTCMSLVSSPLTGSGSPGRSTRISCSTASASGLAASIACRRVARRSSVSRRISSAPRVIRDTSKRSSSSRAMCASWRSIMRRASAAPGFKS